MRISSLLFVVVIGGAAGAAQAQETALPIFDAHLHYSHDAWDVLPPKQAVALLRQRSE